MLSTSGLTCLKGDRLLFQGLDLAVDKGEILRVAGGNGTGKSSLLRLLCGLATPDAGTVRWMGMPVSKQKDLFHRHLLYQGHAPALNALLTPLENLRSACACAGDSASTAELVHALDRIGLEWQADLPLQALSQGQRRRAGLARLFLARHRPLWILDEPFSALDADAVAGLVDTIQAHAQQGGAIVLTTHQELAFTHPPRTLHLGGLS